MCGDVALDPVEIDDDGRRAELLCDLPLECFGAHVDDPVGPARHTIAPPGGGE
jgi:hypothetical protein